MAQRSLPAGAADQPLLGIFIFLAAMAVLPVMDGFAKYLGSTLPIAMIVWARFTFHSACIVPLALAYHGRGALLVPRIGLQILRSIMLIAGTFFFFWSLRTLPLADALSLFFISPMVATVMAALFLKEQVGIRRWLAVLAGFCGTLIIIRPGFAEITSGTFLALATGLVFAAYVILTRRLAGTTEPLVTLAYTGIVGAIALNVFVPFVWVAPAAHEWPLLIGVGLLAALGHYLMLVAYDKTSVSVLAPFQYTEIIGAVLVGYIGFSELPDRWTAVGVAILVASGVYISLREARLFRTKPPTLPHSPAGQDAL